MATVGSSTNTGQHQATTTTTGGPVMASSTPPVVPTTGRSNAKSTPVYDEVMYAIATEDGNDVKFITTKPSPHDMVLLSARIPASYVRQHLYKSRSYISKRMTKILDDLKMEFSLPQIAQAKLHELQYEDLPALVSQLDTSVYMDLVTVHLQEEAAAQMAPSDGSGVTDRSDSSYGSQDRGRTNQGVVMMEVDGGKDDRQAPVRPTTLIATNHPKPLVGRKRPSQGPVHPKGVQQQDTMESKRARGEPVGHTASDSHAKPQVERKASAIQAQPLNVPEWVLMQNEDLLSEKMRSAFIRGKLERRVIKLDNRLNKLKSVLERQNEVVETQAREFEELREIKKSAETSIDTLRSQLTSKEHELEQLRRSGATASTQLPATLPADASEQQRLYTEALKEAEEAKAESQYHEEQFTRMAIETSKAKDKLHETRDVLIAAAKDEGPLHGVLMLKSVGEIIEEDLCEALGQDSKRKPTQRQLDEAFDELDGALRNPQIQPLIMHEGHVRGVNKRDPFLQTLKTKYGSNTAKYFVEKLRESEEYNPSGRYPVVVLWKGDREMEVSEAVLQCVRTIHSLRKKNRKLKKIIQNGGLPIANRSKSSKRKR